MSKNAELASLLADILDDTKPLPVAQPAPKAVKAVPTPAPRAASNPVDEFMAEYLGETESVVTQLCETVQAGPGASGNDYTKPTQPLSPIAQAVRTVAPPRTAPDLLQAAVEAGETASAMGAAPSVVGEIVHAELARGFAGAVADAAEDAGMEGVEVSISTAPDMSKIFADSGSEEISHIVFPKFQVQDFAEAADMRNFATLVTLNTSRWHAKVKDRVASQSAATTAGADKNAFETRKNLLVGVDSTLKKVHRAIDDARAKHYEMTVPFTTTSIDDTGRRTGGRLLPNTLFDEYITIMAQHQKAMREALNEFIPQYPQLIQEAQAKLGDRFVPSEYPNPSSIRTKFNLSFDFSPIPAGDDFKGLAATQLDALAKKLNRSLEQQIENAMQDLWARIHEAVSRMAERLGSPDKTFHNTLVQNVRDVARLAGHLNVIGDPKVEEVRKLIEVHLCQHEPKDLREKPMLRQQTAAFALDILQRMSR